MARRAIFNLSNGQKVSYDIEGAHPSAEEMAYVREQENDPDLRYFKPFSAYSNILQGSTLGTGDEIMGGVGGAYEALTGGDFSEGYERVRDAERERLEMQRLYDPVTSAALEVLTPAGLVGLVSKIPKVKGLLQQYNKFGDEAGALKRTATDAGILGTAGGIYGFGESTAQTPAEIATDAMYGAGIGAAFPLLATPTMAVARTVGSVLGPRFAGLFSALGAPKNAAQRELRTALEDDGIDLNTLEEKLIELGPEATPADISRGLGLDSVNTANLMRLMTSQGGKSESLLTSRLNRRNEEAQGRLQDDLADMMGMPSVKGLNTVDARKAIKAELAKQSPKYEEVMENTTIRMSDELRRVLNKPFSKSALRQAKINMDNEGIPGFSEQMELDGDTLKMVKTPTLRTLDQVKRSLDEEINQLMGGNLTETNLGQARRLVIVRNELVDELDRQSIVDGRSVYKEVRDNYAPGLEADAALKRGRKFFRSLEEDIEDDLSDLGEAGLKAYRFGAARAILKKINSKLEANQTWTPTLEEKNQIKTVFGKNADEMLKSFNREARFGKVKNYVTGGSQTFDKDQMKQRTLGDIVEDTRQGFDNLFRPNRAQVTPELMGLLEMKPANLQRQMLLNKQESFGQGPIAQTTANLFDRPTRQAIVAGGVNPALIETNEQLGLLNPVLGRR